MALIQCGLLEAELKEQLASAREQPFLYGKIPSTEHRLPVCLCAVRIIPKGPVARMSLGAIAGIIPVETY